MPLKILVFGKQGQVATCLQRHALQENVTSVAAGRPDCDITDARMIERQLELHTPNIVINAAAYTAVDKAESEPELAKAINADAAGAIAASTGKRGIPLIHISTDYVFSGDKPTPYRESDLPSPQSVYGATKLLGEELVSQNNAKHLIIRTAWVYSAFGSNFLKTMLRLANERDAINVVNDQLGNPTDAYDLAKAILLACNTLASPQFKDYGTYHYCGPERMSWRDFAVKIFGISDRLDGPTCDVNPIPSTQYPTPARRPANSSLDTSRFFQIFKHKQMPLDASIECTVQALLDA